MSFRIWRLRWALAAALAMQGPVAAAESFPARPIRIVVPSAPGGALDIAARVVAERMAENLQQTVIIDNRPGADSLLGTRYAKSSPADGYTLLAHTSTLTALPALKISPGFDLAKDFAPIGPFVRAPQLMVVGAGHPVQTLSDFIVTAKSMPYSYASGGTGSTLHLGAAMFFLQQHLELLHVPYKGAGAALPDVAAERVSTMFAGYSGVRPYLQGGKVRALGVTGSKRLSAAPDVPTFTEQGIPYTYYFWVGLLAPAGTPRDVVQRLSDAVRAASQSKEMQEWIKSDGSEAWTATPEEFAKYIAVEAAATAKLVVDLKIPKD